MTLILTDDLAIRLHSFILLPAELTGLILNTPLSVFGISVAGLFSLWNGWACEEHHYNEGEIVLQRFVRWNGAFGLYYVIVRFHFSGGL